MSTRVTMMGRFFLVLLAASVILNGVLAWRLADGERQGAPSPGTALAPTPTQAYLYLSRRIFRDNPNDILINFVPLRSALIERMTHVKFPLSIYFEYLPTGSSVGVKEEEEIIQASLIKVPAVMALYKEYEDGKLKPDQRVRLVKSDLDEDYGTLWKKGEGYELTVDEAVRLTLIDSDNTSYRVIRRLLSPTALDRVMNSLDIPIAVDGDLPVVSAKNYSSILRSLYLSYYLTPEHSDEILGLLTKSTIKDMIVAGVPRDVSVAHKFGEHSSDDPQASVHSDCGIIYAPDRPYILCLFGKGDRSMVRPEMQRISKMVYEYIVRVQAPQ